MKGVTTKVKLFSENTSYYLEKAMIEFFKANQPDIIFIQYNTFVDSQGMNVYSCLIIYK